MKGTSWIRIAGSQNSSSHFSSLFEMEIALAIAPASPRSTSFYSYIPNQPPVFYFITFPHSGPLHLHLHLMVSVGEYEMKLV